MKKSFTIGLVGNPNCGKTTLFNALTGSTQRVGNWPGVTVERKSGEFRLGEATIEVVDLPGTYSLDVVDRDISLDERVARQELDHCEMFHAQAVRLIRDYAKEPPESMRAIWEYEHDKIMERDAEIRVKLGLYSSMK